KAKTADEIAAVLAPKVAGLVALDRATAHIPLTFFAMCSSIAALGNVGQADYASANAFMDWYAQYRTTLVSAGTRHGRTLAIDWPLWAEGGMQVDAATIERMRRRGSIPMSTAHGLDAFYQAYAFGAAHVIVVSGDSRRVEDLQCESNAG